MADIRQTTREIVEALNQFIEASNASEEEIKEFKQQLSSLSGASGQFIGDMNRVVTSINNLVIQLKALGAESAVLDSAKVALQRYNVELGNFAAIQNRTRNLGRIGPGPGIFGAGARYLAGQRTAAEQFTRQEMADQLRGIQATVGQLSPEALYTATGGTAEGLERTVALLQQRARLQAEAQQQLGALQALYVEEANMKARIRDIVAEELALQEQKALAARQATPADPRFAALRGLAAGGGIAPDLGLPEGEKPIGELLRQYENVIPGGERGFQNLTNRMEEFGITSARITRASRDVNNGILTMSFSMQEADGVFRQGVVRMDDMGNILRDTSRRFRSFGEVVGLNIIKVIQWAAATGIVYGAMRALSQVTREVIDIQARLAQVNIAVQGSQEQLNQVFEEAIEIANLTSSSVAGVVEGYALAYRAAGSVVDPTERAAVANNLLQESMVLAKLAGVEQAVALDTLVGALRQTGRELDQGRELLDQWVKVSRTANVSLDTLAQTYAIVGTTAEGVGLQLEELNALAATLAEATGLSATETGNAIRGIVAGFQTATAEQTLGRFGIATRTATGELRDFFDVYLEVANLAKSGIISQRDVTEIANAIGGGYRRGAQVQTALENSERVLQLIDEQRDAGGEAADALAIKMDTLESAITRLGNAFTEFAQTLGEDAGLLDSMTLIVDVITAVLEQITKLVEILGEATPAVATFVAAWAVLQTGVAQRAIAKGPFSSLAPALGIGGPTSDELFLQARLTSAASGNRGAYARRPTLSQQGRFGGILPYIVPAMQAYGQFARGAQAGDVTGGAQQAGVTVVGAIVGGLIGSATGIGTPIGAAIGSTAATAFTDAVTSYDMEAWWREVFTDARKDAEKEATEGETPLDQHFGIIAETLSGLSAWLGRIAIGGSDEIKQEGFLTGLAQARVSTPEEYEARGGIPFFTVSRLLLPGQKGREAAQEIVDALYEAAKEEAQRAKEEGLLEDVDLRIDPVTKQAVQGAVEEFLNESLQELRLGEISPDIYRERLGRFEDTSATALGAGRILQAGEISGLGTSVQELLGYYLELDDATRVFATTLANDVIIAQEEYNQALAEGSSAIELAGFAQRSAAAQQRFRDVQPALRDRALLASIDRRPVFEAGRLNQQQIARLNAEADRVRDEYALRMANGSLEAAEIFVESFGDVVIAAGEGIGRDFVAEFADQEVGFITQAAENLGYDTLLGPTPSGQFQDLRDQLGLADLPALLQRYSAVKGTFQTLLPEYDVQEDPTLLIMKDGFETLDVDLTLLNLAMQDLIDINEQQLEGVWNLPSGQTAFVAWSSLFSRDVGGGGGSAFPFFEGTGDTTPSTVSGRTGTFTSLDPITQEINRVAALIDEVNTRINRPGTDQATFEQGDQILDELSIRLTQLLEERTRLEDSRAQTAIDWRTGEPIAGGIQEPVTAEQITEQFVEAFQLENRIELNANIRLVVDGRTLANVVKQYLFEDLVSATDRSLGGGGGYVIEGE
jgi:TP901 family phage tail tape measure protein